ncbi:hypothetical protein EAX61_11060 [Dokdonia sinensis]|uniref:Iron-binding zinc finger CDGSH type domain-containing protein n=1 Tax=Dokdonia sinensis TaxID=2479847 RepID=A0A3M0FYD3_9FLAO|nr:(4Fe-4S)-binding protein [Dokdonia sinensis]RMB57644.1 hypothetical protein EAX61_11060 [Dokdonia sinensis]
MSKIKDYSNGEITVHWEPSKCWHFGACVRMLPDVYDPEKKPWITPEDATTEALKNQIAQCPSGALSYSMDSQTITSAEEGIRHLNILKDGPILSKKEVLVTYEDGTKETKFTRRSYCRCGASDNLPFCNGNHNKNNFKAEAHNPE